MRYENPLYMAEDAGAADIINGGRLQLMKLLRCHRNWLIPLGSGC
jgi:hypothetical protein